MIDHFISVTLLGVLSLITSKRFADFSCVPLFVCFLVCFFTSVDVNSLLIMKCYASYEYRGILWFGETRIFLKANYVIINFCYMSFLYFWGFNFA